MGKMETDRWGEFCVGELFNIHPTKHYNGKNGRALSNAELFVEDGKNPVVVNSSYNNGIGGYTNMPCNEKGGIITFSDTTTTDAIFYQPNDFVGYSHVQGMYPHGKYVNNWTEYSMKFFEAVFHSRADDLGYNYVNKFTRELAKNIVVKLPVDENLEPDWGYMEAYMKKIGTKVGTNIRILDGIRQLDKHAMDTSKWGEFVISDLFDIHPTKAYKITNADLFEEDGKNPVVVNSGFNNGIGGYTNLKCTERAGVITFTDTAAKSTDSFFYQETDFVGYPHVQGMYAKNHCWNKYESMFLTSVMKSLLAGKYDFISKMTRTDILALKIKLPVDNQGNIDYPYMTHYMMEIEAKVLEQVKILQK
jgi:hypothetical protein